MLKELCDASVEKGLPQCLGCVAEGLTDKVKQKIGIRFRASFRSVEDRTLVLLSKQVKRLLAQRCDVGGGDFEIGRQF